MKCFVCVRVCVEACGGRCVRVRVSMFRPNVTAESFPQRKWLLSY